MIDNTYVVKVQYELVEERKLSFPCRVSLTVISTPAGLTDNIIPNPHGGEHLTHRQAHLMDWEGATNWVSVMNTRIEKRVQEIYKMERVYRLEHLRQSMPTEQTLIY